MSAGRSLAAAGTTAVFPGAATIAPQLSPWATPIERILQKIRDFRRRLRKRSRAPKTSGKIHTPFPAIFLDISPRLLEYPWHTAFHKFV